MPSYTTLVKIHRFLVKFIIFFGLIQLITGLILEFPQSFPVDYALAIWLHRQNALVFGPLFTIMLTVGTLMYFHPQLSKIFSTHKPMSWQIKLTKKLTVAAGTMSFIFEKPRGFNFVAGQHLEWEQINPSETDAEGENRTFTISSAPFEDYLSFTTRLRDTTYKRVLSKFKAGDTLQISGLEGDFISPNDISKPLVFLAGGIGITPFRSMLLQATHDQTNHEIYLFYSNRTPSDAPFLEELKSLTKQNPRFHLILTFTDKKISGHESGYINGPMIKKYLKNFKEAFYYLAGPPQMVLSLKDMLGKDLKIPPSQILTDSFTGY